MSRIACLGPEGSFSHHVATLRFPGQAIQMLASVEEVFDWLEGKPDAQGIVPIENSSGGIILATVDRLMHPRCELKIQEELTLDVKLALVGVSGAGALAHIMLARTKPALGGALAGVALLAALGATFLGVLLRTG